MQRIAVFVGVQNPSVIVVLCRSLNEFLAPIREHFKKEAEAKKAQSDLDKCLKKLAKAKK